MDQTPGREPALRVEAPRGGSGRAAGRQALETILSSRVVIVTGKGGVGKTTLAAALARLGSERGRRVLVAETGGDPAAPSPLLEALVGPGRRPSEEPVEVEPGLSTVLLTPEAGHRAFLRDVLPLGFLADRALRAEPLRRFLGAAPAFSELGVLFRGLQLIRAERRRGVPDYDLVIIDAPATGHALAFASLPELVLKIIPGGPIGRACREGLDLLTDPAQTRVMLATLPEALPASEALELLAGLEHHRLAVAALVANLVPHDPFSPAEHDALSAFLGADASAAPVLGGRSVGKLRRAASALERLRDSGRALLTVREHADRGPALVQAMATELLAA